MMFGQSGEECSLRNLILVAVSIKVAIFLLIGMAFYMLPFCTGCHDVNFVYPAGSEITLATAYKTWDAYHFLYLAEAWYKPSQLSNAFYPLFPFLIRAFSIFTLGNTLLAGLILSNAFSVIALVYFYRLVRLLFNERTAFISGLLLIAFPTGFFMSLVYTESLFIMLVCMLFYALYDRKPALGIAAGFLLPLTRPQGILVAVPIAVYVIGRSGVIDSIRQRYGDRYLSPIAKKLNALLDQLHIPEIRISRAKMRMRNAGTGRHGLMFLASMMIGLAVYMMVMWQGTGNPFTGFEAQGMWGHSYANVLDPGGWLVRNFVNLEPSVHGYRNSIVDRAFFIILLPLLFLAYKHTDNTLFTYALLLGVLPAMVGNFMSYTRYLLPAFPIFIAMAVRFERRYQYLVFPGLMVQALFLVAHSLNYWVA